MMGTKQSFLFSLLRLALAAAAVAQIAALSPPAEVLVASGGAGGGLLQQRHRRKQPGAILLRNLLALQGAACTIGGCVAQAAGVGSVKAAQKISGTTGNGPQLKDRDEFGRAVASVGDIDGDSVTDICVGAYRDDDGGVDRGAIYVLFLNFDGTVKDYQKISSAAGGLTASGATLNDFDYFGVSVASVGDIDGDSVNDICVGAYLDNDGGNNCGATYVLFLNFDGTVKDSQKISSVAGGLTASGVTLDNEDRFGGSIASLGDFDSDSVTDICVGAAYDDGDGPEQGAVYILLLSTNGTVKDSQKISAKFGGLVESGVLLKSADFFGISSTSVGDLDGDSVTDICVGAISDDDGCNDCGAIYTLFLNINGTVKASQKISSLSGGLSESGVSLSDQDQFGRSIASVFDVDGISLTGIFVGADLDDDGGAGRGALYMLFLNVDGTVRASQKISSTAGGLDASGAQLGDDDRFGISVASVGDFDGDSVTEICAGAYKDSDGGVTRGAVYMLFLNGGPTQSTANTATTASMTLTSSLSTSSMSSSGATSMASGITTATPGQKISKASDSDITTVLIVVPVVVGFVLFVCGVAAVVLFFRARHENAMPAREEFEMDVPGGNGVGVASVDSSDVVTDAGLYHNAQGLMDANQSSKTPASKEVYHNVAIDGSSAIIEAEPVDSPDGTTNVGVYHNAEGLVGVNKGAEKQ